MFNYKLQLVDSTKGVFSDDNPPSGPAYVDIDENLGIYCVRFGLETWFLGQFPPQQLAHPESAKEAEALVINDSFGCEFGSTTMCLVVHHYNHLTLDLVSSGADSDWTAKYQYVCGV